MASEIGTTLKVTRGEGFGGTGSRPARWSEVEGQYGSWGGIEDSKPSPREPIWYDLEGRNNPVDRSFGGVQSRQFIVPSEASRLYVAARVYSPVDLTEPLVIQLVSESGTVLVEKEAQVSGGQVAEWYVGYSLRDLMLAEVNSTTWGEVEQQYSSYGEMEGYVWQNLGADPFRFGERVTARLIQRGETNDVWFIDSLSLFDDPILWEFSRDGGENFYPALDIRNNPTGVLVFPDDGPGAEKSMLRWRVTGYAPGIHISSLSLRPWYEDIGGGASSREGLQGAGPNLVPVDHYPPITTDARYKAWAEPIPEDWTYAYRKFLLSQSQRPVPPSPEVVLPDTLTGVDEPPDITVGLLEGAVVLPGTGGGVAPRHLIMTAPADQQDAESAPGSVPFSQTSSFDRAFVVTWDPPSTGEATSYEVSYPGFTREQAERVLTVNSIDNGSRQVTVRARNGAGFGPSASTVVSPARDLYIPPAGCPHPFEGSNYFEDYDPAYTISGFSYGASGQQTIRWDRSNFTQPGETTSSLLWRCSDGCIRAGGSVSTAGETRDTSVITYDPPTGFPDAISVRFMLLRYSGISGGIPQIRILQEEGSFQ